MAPNNDSIDSRPSAAIAWFSPSEVLCHQAVEGGLSGGRVWKLTLLDGTQWALRQWPLKTPRNRIDTIHQTLDFLGSRGCRVIPTYRVTKGGTDRWIEYEHAYWDCATWIDGDAQGSTLSAVDYAGELSIGAALFSKPCPRHRCPGIEVAALVERLQRINALGELVRDHGGKLLERAKRHPWSFENSALIDGVLTFLRAWQTQSTQMSQILRRHMTIPWQVTWVVRDCHRGNAIFKKSKLAAWIDFDATRVDTPAVDLGRILSSLDSEIPDNSTTLQSPLSDPHSIKEIALDAYQTVSPLNEDELQLVLDFRWINPLITLGNWLEWTLIEARQFGPSPETLLARIRGWATAVVQR